MTQLMKGEIYMLENLIRELNEVAEQLHLMETSNHFYILNENGGEIHFNRTSKIYKNVIQYLYNRQVDIIKEIERTVPNALL